MRLRRFNQSKLPFPIVNSRFLPSPWNPFSSRIHDNSNEIPDRKKELKVKNQNSEFTMKSIFFFLFLFSTLIPLSTQTSESKDTDNPQSILNIPPTPAHAKLADYGFPFGLLPSSVSTYTVNDTSGDFSLDLGDSCKFTLPPDNYLASYSRVITGKIVKDRIHSLDGIRVRALFQWWSITGIRSSGENLVFEVGVITVKYPANNFDRSPVCEGRRSAS